MAVTATALGNIAANSTIYKSSEVDTLLSGLQENVNSRLTSAMHYKGTVAAYANLPVPTKDAEGEDTVTVEVGDVYNCTDTGKNYAASAVTAAAAGGTGSVTWDELSGVMSIPEYLASATLEGKYLQIANTDTKCTELGYLKESGVNSLISTALADYTKTTDLGDLASLDEVAEEDLASALATKINAAATQAALDAVDAKFDDYTKTADLGDLASKDEVAESDLASALATKINAAATSTDLTTLAGRVTTNEGDIDTAESDIDDLETKVAAIAAGTKATRSSCTLYEVYDMVAAVIDACADAAD